MKVRFSNLVKLQDTIYPLFVLTKIVQHDKMFKVANYR